jgi:hypothetical protein
MDNFNQRKQEVTADQENMLETVARVAATKLSPIETHAICVLLSMAFGTGTLQSRIFAAQVNAIRLDLGLPQITQAAAGNPTMEEKMTILRSAMEKLGDEASGLLIQVLLLSPLYASAQTDLSDEEENKE